MSDYSTFALFTAGLAVFAPLVSAHDKAPTNVPGGSNPTAGAIFQPGLNAVVPAGSGFSVTWKATKDGCGEKIDLLLLKGPSSSQMAPSSYIAQGLNNNGSYSWTPSTSLEPSDSNYAIELICQETKAYQYSTRFGISNDKYVAGSDDDHSAHSNHSSTTKSGSASATPKYPVGTGTATGGMGYPNGTEPTPTGSLTVPSSLRTTTSVPATTNRAATTAAQSTISRATGAAAAALQTGASGLLAAAALAALAL